MTCDYCCRYVRVLSWKLLFFKGNYDKAQVVLSSLRNEYDNIHEELEDMKVTALKDAKNSKSIREIVRHKGKGKLL